MARPGLTRQGQGKYVYIHVYKQEENERTTRAICTLEPHKTRRNTIKTAQDALSFKTFLRSTSIAFRWGTLPKYLNFELFL